MITMDKRVLFTLKSEEQVSILFGKHTYINQSYRVILMIGNMIIVNVDYVSETYISQCVDSLQEMMERRYPKEFRI